MNRLPLIALGMLATLMLGACQQRQEHADEQHAETAYDTLIINARIVDGSGAPWYRGDVGVIDGRIAAIGNLHGETATETIDAADRVLTPGFIDLLSQYTTIYINDPGSAGSRLFQGITTHVSGEGWSYAPQNELTQPEPVEIGGQPERWTRFSEYFAILEKHGIPLNAAFTVGASQVRQVVVGEEDRPATPEELDEMRRLVDQAMADGATGLSSALIYPPGAYATDDELVALAEVVARYGGVYSTHMRNESHHLLEAIDNSISVAQRAKIPLHIYHLKAAGAANWDKMSAAIARIDAARDAGMEVTSDIYPYIRVGLGIDALIPPHYFANGVEALREQLDDPAVRSQIRKEIEAGGDQWENWFDHTGQQWDKVLIIYAEKAPNRIVEGKSVALAAAALETDPWSLFFDLVQVGDVAVTPEVLNEDQKHEAITRPWMMVETDMSPVNPDTATSTHPRAMGAFPRVLARYVREQRLISLEDAIQRMTWMPARLLGLRDRGLIAVGMAADLALFDPERIQDKATFTEPLQQSEGIDQLWVNGVAVVQDGQLTGARPGQILKPTPAR